MIFTLVLFMLGVFIGAIFGLFIVRGLFIRKRAVGNLRVDHSIPEDQVYLFLEIFPGGREAILHDDYVVLKVKRENYIPSQE